MIDVPQESLGSGVHEDGVVVPYSEPIEHSFVPLTRLLASNDGQQIRSDGGNGFGNNENGNKSEMAGNTSVMTGNQTR